MKRLILTFVFALVILAIPMKSEARNEEVTLSSASVTSSGATVSGSTDAPAVMVQIRDANNNIVAMSSFAVVNNAFSGTVSQSLSAGSTYTIYVADYEGGPFATEEATVPVTPAASPSSSNGSAPGGTQTITEQRIYTVIKGDSLRKISVKLGVTLNDLRKWNTFKNINLIYPGQKIVYYVTISKGDASANGSEGVYIVQKGDNLTKIARRLKTTIRALLSKNYIKNKNLIYPGQIIEY